MKNFNKLIILLLSLIFIFLNGCKNLRENLSLKKKVSTDEFLVQKKNPLVLPPDYRDLPKPTAERKITNQKEKEIDLSKIFNNSKVYPPELLDSEIYIKLKSFLSKLLSISLNL